MASGGGRRCGWIAASLVALLCLFGDFRLLACMLGQSWAAGGWLSNLNTRIHDEIFRRRTAGLVAEGWEIAARCEEHVVIFTNISVGSESVHTPDLLWSAQNVFRGCDTSFDQRVRRGNLDYVLHTPCDKAPLKDKYHGSTNFVHAVVLWPLSNFTLSDFGLSVVQRAWRGFFELFSLYAFTVIHQAQAHGVASSWHQHPDMFVVIPLRGHKRWEFMTSLGAATARPTDSHWCGNALTISDPQLGAGGVCAFELEPGMAVLAKPWSFHRVTRLSPEAATQLDVGSGLGLEPWVPINYLLFQSKWLTWFTTGELRPM